MKTIIIKNRLEKVVPLIFKKLADLYYLFDYNEDTKIFSTNCMSNHASKFAIKYDKDSDYYNLLINSDRLCISHRLDKNNPGSINFIINDNGDIYFKLINPYSVSFINIYIYRNLTDSINVTQFKQFDELLDICDAIGDIYDDSKDLNIVNDVQNFFNPDNN